MPLGVNLQLFNGAVPQASLSGIQALWWDVEEPYDATTPIGRSNAVTTDGSGFINLDLSDVSGLTSGDYGFLVLYKLDPGDHQDSLVFSGRVETSIIGSGVSMAPPQSTWVRNPTWLAMPDLTGLQKFAGLHAVFPESSFCALSAAGNYTVDWGDGTVSNISGGVTAYHQYSFADVDLANTNGPVTLQDTGDTVTRTTHGYTDGMRVTLYNIVSTTGIVEGAPYFVISATANTFQLSNTLGGSAIPLTTNGSATLLPYKQAMVTVVPDGGDLTALNLHVKHNQAGLGFYNSGFMDIAIRAPLMTDLRIGVPTRDSPPMGRNITFNAVERVSVIASSLRQCGNLFFRLPALKEVSTFSTSSTAPESVACTFQDAGNTVTKTAHGLQNGDTAFFTTITTTTGIDPLLPYIVLNRTANTFQVAELYDTVTPIDLMSNGSGTLLIGTNFRGLFSECSGLEIAPKIDTSKVAVFLSMFESCTSLRTVPLLDTSAGVIFTSMFAYDEGLEATALFDTSSGVDFKSMFQNCRALQTVPHFDTSAGTGFSAMFASCNKLRAVPLLDTSAGTGFIAMFDGCINLRTAPHLDTSAGLYFQSMFAGCHLATIPHLNTSAGLWFDSMFSSSRITEVPLLDTSSGISFSYMFNTCPALRTVPHLDTSAGEDFSYAFQDCQALEEVPPWDISGATALFGICAFSSSISRSRLVGTPEDIEYFDCKLSATALNEIYTALPVVVGKTITVSGNWGTATDNPAIATGKGWTVTG